MRSRGCHQLIGFVALLALLMAPVQTLGAEQSTSQNTAASVVTESDAVRATLANSHELTLLTAEVRALEFQATSMTDAVENPEIRMRDLSSDEWSDSEERQLQLGVRWSPPELCKSGLLRQEAVVALWEKRLKEQLVRAKLTASIQQLLAEHTLLESLLEAATLKADWAQQRFEVIENQVAQGERSVLDRVKARKQARDANQDRERIRNRYTANLRSIRVLTGINDGAVFAAQPLVRRVFDRDQLYEQAKQANTAFVLAQHRAELASKQGGYENAKLIPWISFVELNHHFESDQTDWEEVSFGLRVPLFNWNRGNRKAAASVREHKNENLAATVQTLRRELDAAVDRYDVAYAEWREIKKDNDGFLPRIAEMIKVAQEQSVLPGDELIDLRLAKIEAETMQREAAYEMRCAYIEICRIVGHDELGNTAQQTDVKK